MDDHDQLDADIFAQMAQDHFQKMAHLAIYAYGGARIGQNLARAEAAHAEENVIGNEELEKIAKIGLIKRLAGGVRSMLSRTPPAPVKASQTPGVVLKKKKRSLRTDRPGQYTQTTPTPTLAPKPTPTPTAPAAKPAPAQPTPPTPDKKKGMRFGTKAMLGTAAVGVPTVYLGGKALDTTKAFLTPRAPGAAHVYGAGAPAHFRRSWGM